MSLTPLSDRCRHIALIFNDDGFFVGKQKISYKKNTFSYSSRTYNFLPDNCSVYIRKGIFIKNKYYFYNLNNPNPFLLNNNPKPILDAEVYKSVLENNLIEQLNSLSSNSFLEFIKKYWLLILVVIGLCWFIFSGHNPFINSNSEAVPQALENNITMIRGGF